MTDGPQHSSHLPPPPAHVAPYVRLLGFDEAIAFLLAFGGSELYLPQRNAPPQSLVSVVGEVGANALCAAGPRLPRRVPVAKPWLAAVFFARGLSASEIARKLHVTDVSVRRWLKRGPQMRPASPPDPRQMRLL